MRYVEAIWCYRKSWYNKERNSLRRWFRHYLRKHQNFRFFLKRNFRKRTTLEPCFRNTISKYLPHERSLDKFAVRLAILMHGRLPRTSSIRLGIVFLGLHENYTCKRDLCLFSLGEIQIVMLSLCCEAKNR